AINTVNGIAIDARGNLYISEFAKVSKVDPDGIITTVAGGLDTGFSGDGGPARDARFYYITGIAVDGAGNLYLTDQSNHRIRKISTDGIVTTIAGNGETGLPGDGDALSQPVNSPRGIAVDRAGNIYYTDDTDIIPQLGFALGLVRKITPDGKITSVIG